MRTMSITIDEQLYRVLKRTAGPRGMSQFVAHAVKDKLRSRRQKLYREYLLAGRDRDRKAVLRDWDSIETEGWS